MGGVPSQLKDDEQVLCNPSNGAHPISNSMKPIWQAWCLVFARYSPLSMPRGSTRGRQAAGPSGIHKAAGMRTEEPELSSSSPAWFIAVTGTVRLVIFYAIVPWALSLTGPRHGWSAGVPSLPNLLGSPSLEVAS